MGWTSYYMGEGYTRKQGCEEVLKAYLAESRMERVAGKLVANPYRGGTYDVCSYVGYVAFRYEEGTRMRDHYGDSVLCLVILLGYEDGEGWYKDMDETVGPCYYDCPTSVLDRLSPTDSEYAMEWRRECYARARKAKARERARRALSRQPEGKHVVFEVPGPGFRWPEGERVSLTLKRAGGKALLMDAEGNAYRTRGMPYECLSF